MAESTHSSSPTSINRQYDVDLAVYGGAKEKFPAGSDMNSSVLEAERILNFSFKNMNSDSDSGTISRKRMAESTHSFPPMPIKNGEYDVVMKNDMESSVLEVEMILKYRFKNKKLLEEALTHSSCTESASYQRLEFVGDAVLGLVFANSVFLAYPTLDQGYLSLIRAANISTEKLARVAVRHGLYRHVRHNAPSLDSKVREFVLAVRGEDEDAVFGGEVKAPKVLADLVESVIAAIYIDCDFDLKVLWEVARGLLEPIITLENLPLQPVTLLFEKCQKQGKQVDFKHWKKTDNKNICQIYVDGQLIATGTSDQKVIAKLNAAKEALANLDEPVINHTGFVCEVNHMNEIEAAKQKLNDLCLKKKWPKPSYRIEKEEGPSHKRRFISSVEIETPNAKLFIVGDEKSRLRDAENSAASMMIRSLVESDYV